MPTNSNKLFQFCQERKCRKVTRVITRYLLFHLVTFGLHAQKVISLNSSKAANFALAGKGQGLSVAIPAFSDTPKVFDRGLADEFARLIEMVLPKAA